MDQAQFRLLSGSTVLDCLTIGDFELVRDLMEQRLLESLCLEDAPTVEIDDEDVVDSLWDQLLAYALDISVTVQQDAGIDSESMRNYSYHLRDYANSWKMLSQKAGDLLNKFNNCPSGVTMQKDIASRIYGYRHHHEHI